MVLGSRLINLAMDEKDNSTVSCKYFTIVSRKEYFDLKIDNGRSYSDIS